MSFIQSKECAIDDCNFYFCGYQCRRHGPRYRKVHAPGWVQGGRAGVKIHNAGTVTRPNGMFVDSRVANKGDERRTQVSWPEDFVAAEQSKTNG